MGQQGQVAVLDYSRTHLNNLRPLNQDAVEKGREGFDALDGEGLQRRKPSKLQRLV